MNCPYCEEPMEEGFLLSERRCGWSYKSEFYTKWKIKLIPIPLWSYGKKEAYCCPNCKKIIINY